ncbi:MAG TPA: LysE family transporter [Bacteroidales bacterium]|nr:LysE family transporter [Bacteroidales bacterium]
MTESIITMSVAGLLAGIVFSMPIAGPVSILITTNALKGRINYCNKVNAGASLATFTYVFFAVYGLTKLYPYYKPAIPYLFFFCSVFLFILGIIIFRTKFDIEHIEEKNNISVKVKKMEKGGFYTGCIINFMNPTLFFGWLTSTFLVISFVSSLGFSTGELDDFVNQSVKEISSLNSSAADDLKDLTNDNYFLEEGKMIKQKTAVQTGFPKHFHLIISLLYAFFIAIGSIIWFYFLAMFLGHFRKKINIRFLSLFVKSLGIVLCFFGLYFGYLATEMLFGWKIFA